MDSIPIAPSSRLLEQFQKRYAAAREVAYLWMSLHNACYFFAIPNRDKFYRPKEQQGEMRGSRVYDTTAIEATKTFVSKLHTAMTPPQTQWGYMQVDEQWAAENPDMLQDAQQMLDDYMTHLFTYLHDSNFDVVINECYFDLAVGTSCLVVNQYTHNQPLLFTSVPMDKLSVEEAMTGKLESWYRYWEDTKINEIHIRWPKAIIPSELKEQAKQNYDATVRIIYEGVMYVPTERKPYHYVVCTDSNILYDEYFDINPGIIWRFQKTNNDVFGRGPIMDALPSIISLNELARIELAAANLNTFKPYMGFSDAVFNPHTFVMQPMTIIPIAPIGTSGQAPLIPLPDSSAPQFSQLTIQDLRMQIRSLLFADSPIPAQGPMDSKQPATATELMINQQMLAQRIGPLFSRLQQEFLFPLIERCGYILDKMGLLPLPKIKGAKINFQYRSPLALAKGQEQIGRFTQYFQILQGIAGPDMAQLYINSGAYPWMLAELMQIDMRFLNSRENVQKTAQSMQQQQAAQQAMQQEEAGAQVAQETNTQQ